MQRVVLKINTRSKQEAITALEVALEVVKKMTDEGPVKQKLIIEPKPIVWPHCPI